MIEFENNYTYILLFTSVVFFIFYKYAGLIGEKINILDKKKIPLIGGIFLYIGFLLNYFFFLDQNLINNYKIDIYFISLIFLIALLDDKYNLSATFRILILSGVIIYFIYSNDFFIYSINSKYLGFYYFPNNLFVKFLFPTFCLIVLLNAFNFTDGINCLATLIGLSWLLYLIIKFPLTLNLYLIFLVFMLFFLIINFMNKSYLGDSGNYIISTIVGSLIICLNEKFPLIFFVEEIFLLFLIPGLDLVRLFYVRINNRKSPFLGDLNHLHHLLINKYGYIKSLIIYISLINIPIYIYFFFNFLLIYLIIFTSVIYFLLIKVSLKKIN